VALEESAVERVGLVEPEGLDVAPEEREVLDEPAGPVEQEVLDEQVELVESEGLGERVEPELPGFESVKRERHPCL